MLLIYLNTLETEEDKIKMAQIYEEYSDLVFSIAKDFLKNQQDAEDAMHDTFLKIVKNINGVDEIPSHKTKGFVVIIVENVCKDFLKRKKIIKMSSFEQIEYEVASEDDVESSVIENITSDVLHQAIDELEPIHQETIMLRYSNQLSYDEMAGILKITNSAARKRVQRARDSLAKKLSENNNIMR